MQPNEQEWQVWLVQAGNFARKENYADGVARARLLLDEVKGALASTTDAAARTRYEAWQRRAEGLLAQLEADFQAWNRAIAERRAARIANADAEQKMPLPALPDFGK
jgi:hypothetical protein